MTSSEDCQFTKQHTYVKVISIQTYRAKNMYMQVEMYWIFGSIYMYLALTI